MDRLLRPFIALAFLHAADAQLLEWRAAIAGNSGTTSRFTTVEALPGDGPAVPPSAFSAGWFEGPFTIGTGPVLPNPTGRDATVVRFDPNPAWDVVWKAHASSTGSVEIADLSISADGTIYVCGSYDQNVSFEGSGLSLNNTAASNGFVARLDTANGDWLGAYDTPGINPVSLVAGPGGDVVLTGPGTLVARYDNGGTQLWSTPPPANADGWGHVAAASDSPAPEGYVMTHQGDLSSQDVALQKINLTTGNVLWTRIMGSPGPDFIGGLDVGRDGDARFSFTSDHPVPEFEGDPIPGIPPTPAIISIVGRITPDGEPLWLVPVGTAQTGGEIIAPDLDLDDAGNAWLAARADGSWLIEGLPVNADRDATLIAIDGTGLLYDFHSSSGSATENALAVAAPTRELAMIAGEYANGNAEFGNTTPLPTKVDPETFISIAEPVAPQDLWVFTPQGLTTVPQLIDILQQTGLQVYAPIEAGDLAIGVSAWATPDQILLLDLSSNPDLDGELESELDTNGSLLDPGWALRHLNDAVSAYSALDTYDYPDTGGEVVVFLIDTAIDEMGGWFDANANLSLEGTTLIRGAGDPTVSSAFEHGTHMLSLIGGPETGAALGTPIRLVNLDIYPNGATTTSALLADAVLEAISIHDTDYPCTPGLICIATSSSSAASSTVLSLSVAAAAGDGLPVVLSAGNSSDDAALYVPSAYGTTSGVICVGASDSSNAAAGLSNTGSPVDLFAPGESIRVVDHPSPISGVYDSVSGTSASSAITAAVAAIHLSINPWLTPAELESAVIADVHSGTEDIVQMSASGPSFVGSFSDWATWHDLPTIDTDDDADGDFLSDGFEFVLGLDPCTADAPLQTPFSFDGTTSEFDFTLSAILYDPASPKTLRDGTTWDVDSCDDLSSWSSAAGSYSYGAFSASQVPVTLTDTPTETKLFMRLEINHAP